jgi:hypothetical protein
MRTNNRENTTEELAAQAGISSQKERILTLETGALFEELPGIIGTGKVGWYGSDHEKLVDKLLHRLLDQAGNRVDLGDKEEIIKLVLCPTEDRQRAVLDRAFAETGFTLDDETADTFELMFDVPTFSDFLAKTKNPQTGDTFVGKPVKGGKLKKFAAMAAAQAATAKAPAAERARREEAVA